MELYLSIHVIRCGCWLTRLCGCLGWGGTMCEVTLKQARSIEQHRHEPCVSDRQHATENRAAGFASCIGVLRSHHATKAWIQGFCCPAVGHSIAHRPSWWLPRMPTQVLTCVQSPPTLGQGWSVWSREYGKIDGVSLPVPSSERHLGFSCLGCLLTFLFLPQTIHS